MLSLELVRPGLPGRGNATPSNAQPRRRATLAIAGAALACIFAACSSQSFQTGQPMPAPPPAPAQPPPPPRNPARMLNGTWSATYPGGPLRVVVGVDPMMRGRNYVATMVDGNQYVPAGQVTWRGVPDPNVPGLVLADQVCATQGFLQSRWVKARIMAIDPNHFTEDLVRPQDCGGFPVKFTRLGQNPQMASHGD